MIERLLLVSRYGAPVGSPISSVPNCNIVKREYELFHTAFAARRKVPGDVEDNLRFDELADQAGRESELLFLERMSVAQQNLNN